MRALSVIVTVLLAGSAYAQGSAVVITPTERDLSVPTYVNATVVRVDARRNTVTFRSDSGEVALASGDVLLRGLGRLRPGDEVILGYRGGRVRPFRVMAGVASGVESAGLSGTVSTPGAPALALPSAPVFTTPAPAVAVAAAPSAPVAAVPVPSTGIAEMGVVTLTAPVSPYTSAIPSLPPPTGIVNVVPPPAATPALPVSAALGTARDVATRDYDLGVRTMALKANEIDMHWARYRDGCVSRTALNPDVDRNQPASNRDRGWFALFANDVPAPVEDNCRQLNVEITRMAEDWRDVMTRMEDVARQNDVLPGAMREVRQRYRVDF